MEFDEILKLIKKGDRYKVDFQVGDIYPPEDKRVNDIFKQFTAASLAKLEYGDVNEKMEDIACSLINLLGENIGTLAILWAKIHNIGQIFFLGGLLVKNTIVKRIFKTMCRIQGKKARFLGHSEFCGAIGALTL